MNAYSNLFDFNTSSLPHITVVSTGLDAKREITFKDAEIKNNPLKNSNVLILSFTMGGMCEMSIKGIKPSFLSTANTSTAFYGPFENRYHLPAGQFFDSFSISIEKEFLLNFAEQGDHWLEGIVQKMEMQIPFSVTSKPIVTSAPLQQLIHQIRDIHPHSALNKLYFQSKVTDLLYTYLVQLQSISVNKGYEGFSPLDMAKLQELKLHLQNNFLSEQSLEGLSKRSGLNLFKLKKGFKLVHGVSVFDYLRQLRMEHASNLLRNTQLNISEVAHQLGYSHVNHFSTAFKKHFGTPPTQWK